MNVKVWLALFLVGFICALVGHYTSGNSDEWKQLSVEQQAAYDSTGAEQKSPWTTIFGSDDGEVDAGFGTSKISAVWRIMSLKYGVWDSSLMFMQYFSFVVRIVLYALGIMVLIDLARFVRNMLNPLASA